jgi:hypothetical protein
MDGQYPPRPPHSIRSLVEHHRARRPHQPALAEAHDVPPRRDADALREVHRVPAGPERAHVPQDEPPAADVEELEPRRRGRE